MVNTDEIAVKDKDGGEIETNDTKQDTNQTKQRTVSFNSDVHVKRFGKPRESRGSSSEHQSSPVRKEPFTNLSETELIAEANKVLEQAGSVTCTADNPPDKFFSLPHRRKFKEHEKLGRRNSDDNGDKTSLGRSTSDVGRKRNKERTSISTLFRRAQKTKIADAPVVVSTKPTVVIKRSKSDVSDLKSNTKLQPKPIRKRSGSETEEFLKSLRNKKTQLSPIIESSPREDYFKKTPPLEAFQKQKLSQKDSIKSDDQKQSTETQKVNPVEKPPRYKSPEKTDPKPPVRTKRGKSAEKDQKENSPPIGETPKRKTQIKKTLLVDEIDNLRGKEPELKNRIQDSIKKIKENVYGSSDMIHSSQKPPDKPPLTRGHTVDHIVRILKEDQFSPPPKAHLISPPNSGSNNNQPFSYFKPSVSPDPNLYIRTTSPERVPSPVNKMNPDKGVVYARVVRGDRGDSPANLSKQTIHTTYSPPKEKFGNLSDEDEGLGHEDQKNKFNTNKYHYNKNENDNFNSLGSYKLTDSPIRPKFREYKLTSFDSFEPTYANEYPSKEDSNDDFIDTAYRGRGDGMDSKRKVFIEPETAKVDVDFNELSHRRELLESRLKARYDRERKNGETLTRYMADVNPIYEADKRMKATEKYVNETAKYYRHNTLERDGFAEDSVTESFRKYDDNIANKHHKERRSYETDHPDFIDRRREQNRFINEPKSYPPEPEYEPPTLEISKKKSTLTPDEYKEKKYKVKSKLTTSHDTLQTGHKYKKDSWFGKRKGHYASNPEIGREDYVNASFDPKNRDSYHNSLKRDKHRSKDYNMRRHDSDESREYYRTDRSPSRYDVDNCLVDSGIVNDFRKSSGDLRSNWYRKGSDDDLRDTSMFLQNERQHAEDVYPSEQIYANGEYVTRFEDFPRQSYVPRERSADDGSHFDPRIDKFGKSADKANAKPPKAVKKLSGLEKMKQLFSRDSSKKSKKEKEIVQTKPRTRVLKSPEHLVRRDSDYRRYRDPEPSDDEVRKFELKGSDTERRYRSSDPDSDIERKYRNDVKEDYRQERRFKEFRESEEQKRYEQDRLRKQDVRRYESSDRESEQRSPRTSDAEQHTKPREATRKSRSMTADSLDSPALAERYRERRRLATPSPTPSPPRRAHPPPPPPTTAGNWFKSLDRLARKRTKATKTQKENRTTTEDEARHNKLNSPAKNLRFFGDTDLDSDTSKQTVTKTKSHPEHSLHRSTLRKTNSNSSAGIDETDFKQKSHSLSNLNTQKRLHNISENYDRESNKKPPIPYDRRSRSQSSTKVGRRPERSVERDRESSSDVRGSKQELNRELKHRRRTPANNSGESSTEGDSSHQSQRSVVYLHATTVGDIPDPGRVGRNRSRDDVSVNSSQIQIRTTAKSFSLFAPWTPRHYPDHHDVHYSQKTRRQSKPRDSPGNVKKTNEGSLVKNKSYSQTTLTRKPQNSRLTSSSQTLYRKPEKKQDLGSKTLSRSKYIDKSHSTEVLRDNERERVSRSISMPKDNNKKAGWFKLSNKNKKPEVNTRVR